MKNLKANRQLRKAALAAKIRDKDKQELRIVVEAGSGTTEVDEEARRAVQEGTLRNDSG